MPPGAVTPMFVDAETDDEVMLDVIGELPSGQRGTALLLALLITCGDSDE